MEKRLNKRLEGIIYIVIICYVCFILLKALAFSFYQIPSDSMKGAIQPGDWICVNKLGYGGRITLFGHVFSLPVFKNVERGDIVVFHFPEGDTVITKDPIRNYYEVKERNKRKGINTKLDLTRLDIDYRLPYVKRCIGLPGEELQIIDGGMFINGIQQNDPYDIEQLFWVYFTDELTCERYQHNNNFYWKRGDRRSVFSLTKSERIDLETQAGIDSIRIKERHRATIYYFPLSMDGHLKWDTQNYGPIQIPQKEKSIVLNSITLPFYKRIIEVYEGNKLEVIANDILINGQKVIAYTPKQDYYFMIGDNRGLSIDSRNWGFVPKDHLNGKAFMIGWSAKPNRIGWKSIRWNRIGHSL